MRAEAVDAELAADDDDDDEEEMDEDEDFDAGEIPDGEEELNGWPRPGNEPSMGRTAKPAVAANERVMRKLRPLIGLWKIGKKDGRSYPPSAIEEPAWDEVASDGWYDRRQISKEKVNLYFFNKYKAPKEKFPHDLRPGDSLRVYFKDPVKGGETIDYNKTREVYFDGVALDFKGDYHARNVRLRSMVGKGEGAVGYEMMFPLHSPLVTKIEVLRRGYIGRNKNAYFLRGMVGKKNQVPLDQERSAVDQLYASLKEEGRESEIPEPGYPQKEHDRLPWSVSKQHSPDWDESMYDPAKVDMRSVFEKRVIGGWRKKTKAGKTYGTR